MSLLQMSISSAILILAVIVIRAVAINKLPKTAFLALWGIVLLKLLIPFSIPSTFSVYSIIGYNKGAAIFEQLPAGAFVPVIENVLPALPAGVVSVSENAVSPLFVIWLIGMVLCTGFFIIAYLRCRFEFSTSLPARNDFVKNWLQEHSIMRSIDVRQSNRISAPLTYGIFKPVILVPQTTDWQDTKQLNYVFLHEYVHIRRFDTITKLICAFSLCVHWFNPLVWVMYILFNRDIELACDERVVRLFGETSKKDYSLMLISMEAKKSGLLPFCNSFSKNAIEERITAIMKIKKITIFSVVAACLVVLGTGVAFATSAHNNGIESNTEYSSSDYPTADFYEQYIPFGLTIDDAGKLYYNSKMIRCFDDLVPAENNSAKAIGYYERNGVIDVKAIRDTSDSKNTLVGLEVLSQQEFDSRIISDPTGANASSKTTMFAGYKSFGLTVDENNALFYDGKRVRLFMDILVSNGQEPDTEEFLGNTVSNWDKNGTVDVYAVRDYETPDSNGYGSLIGLRVATDDEYEANSLRFENAGKEIEIAH